MRTHIYYETYFNVDGKDFHGKIERLEGYVYVAIYDEDNKELQRRLYNGSVFNIIAMTSEIENLINDIIG